VLSEKYRQAFSQFISSNKIFVVPDTCSDDLLRIDRTSIDQIRSQGVFTIVFLGRLTQEKGVSDLLQAAYMLGQHGHVFKLWLCGTALTSVAEMELKQLVERLGLGDKVVFAGAVGTDKKYTLLQNADVVVLPSYSESFGMALLEGMAASLPVIGTRVGCIDEIIVENETGLIYSPGDINALEEALSYLAMNPQTRQQMGSAGRARFRRLYSRSYVVELIGTIYRDIGRL